MLCWKSVILQEFSMAARGALPHLPHSSVPPHRSPIVPQLTPSAAQVVGTHSHLCSNEHISSYSVVALNAHVPQVRSTPQPSVMVPHVAPRVKHFAATLRTQAICQWCPSESSCDGQALLVY